MYRTQSSERMYRAMSWHFIEQHVFQKFLVMMFCGPRSGKQKKQTQIVRKANMAEKFSQHHPGLLKRFRCTGEGGFNNPAIIVKPI